MKNVLGVLFLFLFLACNNNTNIEVRMVNFSRGETLACFVIDKNKNVVGFGYPIESEETWKSFKQIMKNRR